MSIFSIDMDIVIYLSLAGSPVGYCSFNITDKGMDEWREDKSDSATSSSLALRSVTLQPPKRKQVIYDLLKFWLPSLVTLGCALFEVNIDLLHNFWLLCICSSIYLRVFMLPGSGFFSDLRW